MTLQGRVLVVDDNEANRILLRERLLRQVLHVEEAGDGHDALRKLAARPFDLVLLDVMMPGWTGSIPWARSRPIRRCARLRC